MNRTLSVQALATGLRVLVHLVLSGPTLRLLVVVEGLEQLFGLLGARTVLGEVLGVLGGRNLASGVGATCVDGGGASG